MTAYKRVRSARISVRTSGSIAAVVSVALMVAMLAGCPADPCSGVDCDDDNPCTSDSCSGGECENEEIDDCCETAADCDDANACTVDLCGDIEDGAGSCINTAIGQDCCNSDEDCDDGEVCDENSCIAACTADEDCPDDAFCDTDTGLCVIIDGCLSDDDCEGDLICNIETGECVEPGEACLLDSDCADGDVCTVDSCEGGFCTRAPACEDNVDCTDDSCDSASGECTYESNCAVGQNCNTTTGNCDPAVECENDAGCEDDGVFCNGAEICTDDGFCGSGGNPCSAGQICNEPNRNCLTPTPQCINLTTQIETKPGGSGADLFCAPWNDATDGPTLQTGDASNGAEGNDSLTATFQFDIATTVQPTLTSIESITITDAGTAPTTLSAATITGMNSITSANSTNSTALVISNLASIPLVGLETTGSGLTLQFTAGATSGGANAMAVTLSNVSGGALTINTAAANGIESVSMASNGTSNTLDSLAQTTGTTLTTVTITGAAPLTITNALPSTVATLTAGSASGGVSVDLSNNTGNVTATGGAGNDTFTLGSSYTSTDVVSGGAGANTLVLTSAAAGTAVAPQTNVTNISILSITDGLAHAVNATRFGSIATVNFAQGFTAAVPLTLASGRIVNFGANEASTDSTAPITITIDGAATTDSVTLNLRDHDTQALTFNGVETVNLQSNHRADASLADGGVNVVAGAVTIGATATLNISGAANLTLTGVVTAGTLNATAFTGGLTMSATSASAINIAGGAGNDTLWGSASADTINAGSGTNVIEGRSGVDAIGPLGAGVDTIRINIAGLGGADRKLVSGFTVGVGGDVLNIDGDELAELSGSNNFVSSAAMQIHTTAGPLTVDVPTEVVRISSGTVANFTDANSLNGTNLLTAIGDTSVTLGAGGEGVLFAVADAAGNTGIYLGDHGGDSEITAAELTLVAVLQGTPVANLVFSNFANAN